MEPNFRFRNCIYAKWPTAQDASKEIGIDAASLSLLVRNRRKPTRRQRELLRHHFSEYMLRKMFPAETKGGGN
jgi:hypothetical protein